MSENDALKYYEVLKVAPDAPLSEIKRRYYECAKFWHPDHNDSPEAQKMFQSISTAYGVLQNPHDRLVYDILSAVYDEKDFPLIGSLKIYKNQKNQEDKALRVLRQQHVLRGKVNETKDICNIGEAFKMVLSTSVANWLKGWWGKNGIYNTKCALYNNMQTVYADDADNLKLMVHNAIAYEQEKKTEMAWIYAMQADRMLPDGAPLKEKLRQFVESLNFVPSATVTIPYWDAPALKKRQMLFPLGVLVFIGLLAAGLLLRSGVLLPKPKVDSYYEERIINGVAVPSDTIVRKIIKTGSSANSKSDLKHFATPCTIYHGPDERYSPMTEAKEKQTIRVSGYTLNQQWYQIIIDNGEMGYVRASCLQDGMGNPVPFGSKVYKGK